MNIHDYLIAQEGHDWSVIFSDWGWLLPPDFTLWLVNRYGDSFLVTDDGAVHMLDLGQGTLRKIAESRDDFAKKIDEGNNANDWLAIPLVDRCVAAGLKLGQRECYSYKKPPVFGGSYSVENTEVTDIEVHFSLLGQIHRQIQGLPDGTKITKIKLVTGA